MLSLVAAGGWARTIWRNPLARAVIGTLGVLAVLWTFHAWSAKKGFNACQNKVEVAQLKEAQRQRDVARGALRSAEQRASKAENDKVKQQEAYDRALAAALAQPDSQEVCLTEETTDALREIK